MKNTAGARGIVPVQPFPEFPEIPLDPLTLPLSPDSGGEGGGEGDSFTASLFQRGKFYSFPFVKGSRGKILQRPSSFKK